MAEAGLLRQATGDTTCTHPHALPTAQEVGV
jgi:hypothetical protein